MMALIIMKPKSGIFWANLSCRLCRELTEDPSGLREGHQARGLGEETVVETTLCDFLLLLDAQEGIFASCI